VPEYLIYQPPRRPGGRQQVAKIRKPAPLKELLMPVVVSLSLVAGILTTLAVLQGMTDDPPREPPVVFGRAAQPGFRFSRVDVATGRPVRYNPCEPIHYVIDGRVAPAGGIDQVHQAVHVVSEAAGLTFTFDGMTDESDFERAPYQPARYGERWAPVLIGWHHLGENAFSPTPLGDGGSVIRKNALGEPVYVTGSISLNADFADVHQGFGSGRTWGKILLHELGHVVGLGHVSEQSELMYPATTDGPSRLGTGDRLGLMSVGGLAGCLVTPTPAT
jgi:hypothetical protein